jgi:tripartite-type tricarboxylate transporter receptor subunit TctC
MFDGLGSSAAHIKAGRLRALAVAAAQPAPGFPDVPTGPKAACPDLPGRHLVRPVGAQGHAQGHRRPMAAEMKKALSSDELRSTWTGLGTETPNLWGDAFGRFVGSEVKRWAEVVKSSGAKLD